MVIPYGNPDPCVSFDLFASFCMSLSKLCLALLTSTVLPLAASSQQTRSDSAAAVDRIFARFSTQNSPGCAVGVSRNGSTILTRAYGSANLEYGIPNTTETIFESGSVAKQFTAAAIILLAQQGKLSLDDPIRKLLPELPEYASRVTIRHMLNHTSGLRDWGTVASAGGWPRGLRSHTMAHALDISRRQKALNYPPGTEYLYSNTNFTLAAMIAERASGMSFAEFMRTQFFVPLGMKNSRWRDDFTRVVRGRATAYSVAVDGPRIDMPNEDVIGHAGLLTTIADLLIWNENFTTPKVGGRAFVDEIERRGRLVNGREIDYSAGLDVSRYRGVPRIYHTGSTAGYRAFLARYPEQRLSIAILCNAGNAGPEPLGNQVADVFLGSALATPASVDSVTGITLSDEEMTRVAGMYRNVRTAEPLRLAARGSTLLADETVHLVPVSQRRFLSRNRRSEILFEFRGGGRPSIAYLVQGSDTAAFTPVGAPVADPAKLGQYAGVYASDEAEVTYTVAVESGQLVGRRRPNVTFPMIPVYADAFTVPQAGTLVFTRNASGRVNGLTMSLGRVRALHFERK